MANPSRISAGLRTSCLTCRHFLPLQASSASSVARPPPSATSCLVQNGASSFTNDNLSNLFLTMDLSRAFLLNLPAYDNTQVLELFTRTSRDTSNYNALVLDL